MITQDIGLTTRRDEFERSHQVLNMIETIQADILDVGGGFRTRRQILDTPLGELLFDFHCNSIDWRIETAPIKKGIE